MSLPAFAQEPADCPERCLWLGVILQAIDDYAGRSLRSLRDGPDQRKDAEAFLFAPERRGDLELVAQAAGVDVDALRDAARRASRRRPHRVIGRRRQAEG